VRPYRRSGEACRFGEHDLADAGRKPVIFEPAIATELALLGKWDETPLVEMIRSNGFAS